MDESLEGNQDKEETAVKPVPVDGEIMEENLEGNQDDEKTEVTSSPVGGETVEEEFQENLEPENAGAISGPMDKERGTSEDQGEKNQDEEDRQMKMVKRSQTSSPQDWYTQEVPKRMRMQPPARSSLVEPYMAEPAGLDLSVERAGPRDTSDVNLQANVSATIRLFGGDSSHTPFFDWQRFQDNTLYPLAILHMEHINVLDFDDKSERNLCFSFGNSGIIFNGASAQLFPPRKKW